jgi:hypothetical protein
MTKHWKRQRITLPTQAYDRTSSFRLASLALTAIGIGLGFLACGSWKADDALNSLQIVQVQTVSSGSESSGGCVVSGTQDSSSRTAGTLDVYLPDGSYPPYVLPLLIANNLDSVGGTPATEMNNITLTHFSVTLSAPDMTWPDGCPASFDSTPFTILLTPGSTVGYPVTIIQGQHSACLLAALNPQPSDPGPRYITVTAEIVAKGRHGGTSIESAPFTFTVEVCTGCLQDDYTDPSLVRYRYPAGYPACDALSGSNPYQGAPCLAPGQDLPILCCGLTDADGNQRAICPATPTGTGTDTSTATGP